MDGGSMLYGVPGCQLIAIIEGVQSRNDFLSASITRIW